MRNRILLALTVMFLAGCRHATPPPAVAPPAPPKPEAQSTKEPPAAPEADVTSVVAGFNRFALRLLHTQPKGQNLCFSPYSAAACLTMAYAGARGETAKQMADVLGQSLPAEKLHPAAARLDWQLKDRRNDSVELCTANALWADRAEQPRPAFQSLLSETYGAELRLVDFRTEPTQACQAINRLAADQTRGHINELLDPSAVTSDTMLVLTNAVYLKAPWSEPFDETKPGPFHRADGRAVTAPLMHNRIEIPYARTEHWTAVQLPYAGEDLAMLLILPAGKLSEFEANLKADALAGIVDRLKDTEIRLVMPKFEQRSALHLISALKSLGMAAAFDKNKADLSGMFEKPKVWIEAVEHRAWIKVDEQGTEAAAATGLSPVTAAPAPEPKLPPEVRFDRPFLYAIRHIPTRAVLFLGRVADPTAH